MIRCKICNEELNNQHFYARHIVHKHNISVKEYYDEYIKNDNEDICSSVGCNNKTTFLSLRKGYTKHCSRECLFKNRKNEKHPLWKGDKIKKEIEREKYKTSCEICGVKFKNNKGLSRHIVESHNITLREYYIKFLIKDDENEKCDNENCNNDVKLLSLSRGLRKFCCNKCASSLRYTTLSDFKDRSNLIHGNKYNYEKSIYVDVKTPLIITCPIHGDFEQVPNYHLSGNGCQKCGGEINIKQSKMENEINDWLNTLNIKTEQSNRTIIFPLELDLFLPDFNIAIECNGLYWHSEENKKDKNYHLNKTIDCEKQGIKLLHFWDYEWYEKQDIVKSIILNHIGKIENKYFARKLKLDLNIDTNDARIFCETNHIHGFRGGPEKIGLRTKEGELVSLMIVGSDGEMVRFVSKLNSVVIGGLSRLTKHSSVKYSFVDRRLFNGEGYLKSGFKISSFTQPNYFYIKDGSYVGSRQLFQKHKLKDKLKNFDENLTETQNMCNNGYSRVFDCGNIKMVIYG